MKYPLYFLVLICAISVALTSLDAQAARSKPRPKTALLIGPSEPVLSCSQDFQVIRPAETFAELGFGEPDVTYADGYQYDSPGGFSCFVPSEADVHVTDQARAYWMNSIRLIPSFPQIDNSFFLPIGWQWIDFDR